MRSVIILSVLLSFVGGCELAKADPPNVDRFVCEEVCTSKAQASTMPPEVQACAVWTCQTACADPATMGLTEAEGEELGARLMTRCLIAQGLI